MGIVRSICVFTGLLAAASLPMLAQSFIAVKADVPFAMTIGNQQLPSGDYTITPLSGSQGVLLLRSDDGKTAMITFVQAGEAWNANGETILEFQHEGNDYRPTDLRVDGTQYEFVNPGGGNSRHGEKVVALAARSVR